MAACGMRIRWLSRHTAGAGWSASGRVPRHFGDLEQPQKAEPACLPRRAVRRSIGLPQVGQVGVVAASSAGAAGGGAGQS